MFKAFVESQGLEVEIAEEILSEAKNIMES